MTIGSQTEYFDPPRLKDIGTQAVVKLRRMLTKAGYRGDAANTRTRLPALPGRPVLAPLAGGDAPP